MGIKDVCQSLHMIISGAQNNDCKVSNAALLKKEKLSFFKNKKRGKINQKILNSIFIDEKRLNPTKDIELIKKLPKLF